jgi:CheY-like chemotaxis protein
MPRITVVNDNEAFLELVRDILEDDRYEVTTIDGDRSDALARIKASRPDVLMIDLRFGAEGLHGWDIAIEVRREPSLSGLPVLVCSADLEALSHIADRLSETQRVETLTKPFSVERLIGSLDQLIGQAVGRQELAS